LACLLAQLLSQLRDFLGQPWLLHRSGFAFSTAARSSVVGFSSKRVSPPLTETCFQQGPLAPRALPRFFATMGLSDSLPGRPTVMSSRRALVALAPTRQGLQAPRPICPRALSPTTPEGPARCLPVAPVVAGFILVGGLATFVFLSRPNRVYLRYGSRVCLPSRTGPLLGPAPGWLHAEQAIYTVNSFQVHKISQAYPGNRPQGSVSRNSASPSSDPQRGGAQARAG